jgi:phosphonopyruvate decarboxylase
MNTLQFVDELKSAGINTVVGVPCSYMKNLINAFINDPDLKWIPAASEGVACSIAAGMTMSGNPPLVIVQSSGVTNMGSCLTSLCYPYEIYFPLMTSHRGSSEVQHEVLAENLHELIKSYNYDCTILDSEDQTQSPIELVKQACETPLFLIVDDKTFDKVSLNEEHKTEHKNVPTRMKFLENLNEFFKNTDVKFIGTTGNTSREMATAMPDTNNFYQAGNMGNALSVGLGTSMEGNPTVVLGGDAEFVMHMGGMTTAGRYRGNKLVYVVFDNLCNKSTGGQRSYQEHLNYHQIAINCGWMISPPSHINPDSLSNEISTYLLSDEERPLFLVVNCGVDDETPRPTREQIIGSTQIFNQNFISK